jgi:hypothetical protein
VSLRRSLGPRVDELTQKKRTSALNSANKIVAPSALTHLSGAHIRLSRPEPGANVLLWLTSGLSRDELIRLVGSKPSD